MLGYDVIYYGEEVQIPYLEVNKRAGGRSGDGEEQRGVKRKRDEGRSFHHGRFIQRLRQKAISQPNVSVVEATATDLVRSGYTQQVLGVQATVNGEQDSFFGGLTIIADGYASKFRKELRTDSPIVRSKFWGLELIDCEMPMPKHGNVILGDGAPVLLYQIGTHETRALVDIPDNLPSASVKAGGVKAHLRNVVLPSLPACVRPSFAAAIDRDRLRSMPNSWLPPTTNKTPGLILLGDAMNMRHPLTGGGMTVAFNDALLLSQLLHPSKIPMLDEHKPVLQAMRAFHWRRKGLTSVINILAQALYSLFAAEDAQLKALQMGCFRYFQLGGNCIDGPVGLLAGIIRQPFVLFYHFFAVALYSIWIYVMRGSVVGVPVRLLGSVGVFWKACVVIMPYILSELRS